MLQVTYKEIATLFDLNLNAAHQRTKTYRKQLGLKKHEYLTLGTLCNYLKIPVQEAEKKLGLQ